MSENHANPPRLKDRHDQPDLVERIAGQAARDMPEPPQLSASALARIALRIEERTGKPPVLRFGRVLAAAAVLLGIVTVASAARMDLMPRWMAKMVGMAGEPAARESPRASRPRTAATKIEVPVDPRKSPDPPALPNDEAVPEIPAPERAAAPSAAVPVPPETAHAAVPRTSNTPRRSLAMVTASEERPVSGPILIERDVPPGFPAPSPRSPPIHAQSPMPAMAHPTPSERPAPPASDPAPPAPAAVPSPPPPATVAPTPTPNPAARHLQAVVRALRVDHAPRIALDLLDRHAGALEGNAFAEEALLLRVEAMLALRQQSEALRLLDGMALANAASSSVLLVTRGQLRAGANRCAEAVADFDLALIRTLRPSKQALLGRALCKQRLGDSKAAQADLDRLQREFPGEPAP